MFSSVLNDVKQKEYDKGELKLYVLDIISTKKEEPVEDKSLPLYQSTVAKDELFIEDLHEEELTEDQVYCFTI